MGKNKFDFLCPVLDIINNGEFVIMSKANTNNVKDCQVENILNKYGKIREISVHSDIRMKNVGIYNDRPVLVDYPFLLKNYRLY